MRWPFTSPATSVARIEPRIAAAPERRAGGGFGAGFVGLGGGGFGGTAPSYIAENAAAVVGCINAISSGLASLPIRTYRRVAGAGRVELTEDQHWLPRLLRQPSPQCTFPEWLEALVAGALLHGNGLATIRYDQDGQPIELNLVPWPYAIPIITAARKLAFDVSLTYGPFGTPGMFKRYPVTECILLKDRSDNGGWTGRSRLNRSPAVLAAALEIGEYSASVWRNSASPSGVLGYPGVLSPEARNNISNSWRESFSGPSNAKKTPLLEEGVTFTPISCSPMDAETLDSRRFTVVEICRIFTVPPAVCFSMEANAFTSAEQQNRMFASMSLAPWAKKIEALIQKSLLGDEPDIHVEIDFASLVRGDPATRWAAWQIAVQNKILSVDEIRAMEGFSPQPVPGELVPGADAAP